MNAEEQKSLYMELTKQLGEIGERTYCLTDMQKACVAWCLLDSIDGAYGVLAMALQTAKSVIELYKHRLVDGI